MRHVLLLSCLLACAGAVGADDDLHYNQIRLQSQQTESVSNDTMHVTLNTYAAMQDPAKLAAKITMNRQVLRPIRYWS